MEGKIVVDDRHIEISLPPCAGEAKTLSIFKLYNDKDTFQIQIHSLDDKGKERMVTFMAGQLSYEVVKRFFTCSAGDIL